MREREDANRTRVAGNLDEIQGVVANTLSETDRLICVQEQFWLSFALLNPEYEFEINIQGSQ
jgi:hypothetical protein